MFWSKARGKVGDIVISQVKGQTITRAYQPSVGNPRSEDQMTQRAKFGGAVKFYKFATQALFKFAFEDKLQKESDYNAFMRYNAKAFSIMSREDYLDSNIFPIVGANKQVVMSQGRLGSFHVNAVEDFDPDNTSVWVPEEGQEIVFTETPTTWGEVSEEYIKTYGLIDGDIITLVHINTGMVLGAEGPERLHNLRWEIEQYILDSTSAAEIPEIFSINADKELRYTPDWENAFFQYFCVIFSRNTPSGLWVSTSFLGSNTSAESWAESLNLYPMIQLNLKTWGATGKAILQGALATPLPEPEPGPTIEGFRGVNDNEDDAFDEDLSQNGDTLSNPILFKNSTNYVWVKGKNLDTLDDDDLYTEDTGVTDIEFATSVEPKEGYRCITMNQSSTEGTQKVVTINVGTYGSFKVITRAS